MEGSTSQGQREVDNDKWPEEIGVRGQNTINNGTAELKTDLGLKKTEPDDLEVIDLSAKSFSNNITTSTLVSAIVSNPAILQKFSLQLATISPELLGVLRRSLENLQLSDTTEDTEEKPPMPDTVYRIRLVQPNKVDKLFYKPTPFLGVELHESKEEKPRAIIEMCVDLEGEWASKTKSEPEGQTALNYWKTPKNADIVVEGAKDYAVKLMRKPLMRIFSPELRSIIPTVITYYPNLLIQDTCIVAHHPYQPFMHYYHKWVQLKDEYAGKAMQVHGTTCVEYEELLLHDRNPSTMAHALEIFLEHLTPTYKAKIQEEEELWAQRRPSVTFVNLWLLFKPGDDVYAKVDDQLEGFTISMIEWKPKSKSTTATQEDSINKWIITVWNLGFDGRKVIRQTRQFIIQESIFVEAQKEILNLDIFPARFLDQQEAEDKMIGQKKTLTRREELCDRGRKYFHKLLPRPIPVHADYNGFTMGRNGRQYIGPIIIDPNSFKTFEPNAQVEDCRSSLIRLMGHTTSNDDEDRFSFKVPVDNAGGTRFHSYNYIDFVKDTILTDHQYWLLPRMITGFGLLDKRWSSYALAPSCFMEFVEQLLCADFVNELVIFDVDCITEKEWVVDPEDAMANLELPGSDKHLIKALSQRRLVSNEDEEEDWDLDWIPGKGEGQIFLLHGPPGTGKTFTVECVANYTRRPLLTLSVANLGTEEVHMQTRIEKWFSLAALWGAVMLIDEADVFLEKRRIGEIRHNGLVSVFLRSMEYYKGVLFLTTNRIGQIDEAFHSRLLLAIEYKDLTDGLRTNIWNNFLDKVESNITRLIVTQEARNFIEKDKELLALELNGREIRNTLQMAIALARQEVEKPKSVKVSKKKGAKQQHPSQTHAMGLNTMVEMPRVELRDSHLRTVIGRKQSFKSYTMQVNQGKTPPQVAFSGGLRAPDNKFEQQAEDNEHKL